MSDIIHLLPDFVANQIAAGEVIQRPASVVKELLENSIDAGADKIDLWITDGGKTQIQVIDNGKGMSETDARLAFERHATSKIKDAADLFQLHTMGFRGEALASIVAVAQVELKTKTINDEIGTWLTFSGAKVMEQKPVACPTGAQFTINNLFYNVPARRRFLKSNVTETNNIMQEFERVALIHPDVDFSLHRDDVQTLDLRQSSFKKRIVDLFGNNLDKVLLPVHVETSLVTVDGFLGAPESARAKGARQFFFVNDRYMRHPYFHRAIMAAFEKLIPADKQIPYFYCLRVEPSRIDVNIHPTKTEIKFEDEQAIWQIILAVTKEVLGRFNAVPTIDFEASAVPDIPAFRSQSSPSEPKPNVDKMYNPFGKASKPRDVNIGNWQSFYESIAKTSSTAVPANQNTDLPDSDSNLFADTPSEEQTEGGAFVCLQFQNKFIVTPVKSGLMIIDQHRAHIRILYDRFMSNIEKRDGVSQGLLFPELFQVPISQVPILNSLLENFEAVGFDISDMGAGSYAVNGVPSGTEKQNSVEMIMKLLESYEENKSAQESVYSSISLSLARNNAISPSQILTKEEMVHLIEELFTCKSPKYTPDGKIIVFILENEELNARFK